MRHLIDARIGEVFTYQDPRLPDHLREQGKPEKRLDSPVYRICLEAVCATARPSSFLEVGVKRGGSLSVVLKHAPSLRRVVLADFWSVNTKKAGEKRLVDEMLDDARAGGRSLDVDFLDGSSLVTLPAVDERFDLIGIDGSHRRDVLSHDLRQALRLAKPGAFLVLDDLVLHDDHKIDEELLRFVSENLGSVELVYRNTRNWPGGAILRRRIASVSLAETIADAIRCGTSLQVFANAAAQWSAVDICLAAERYLERQDWQALDYLIVLMRSNPVPEFRALALRILRRESLEIDNVTLVEVLRAIGVTEAQIRGETGLGKVINGLAWTSARSSSAMIELT